MFGSGMPDSYEQIEFLSFAIMSSIFFPLYKFFFIKYFKNHSSIEKINKEIRYYNWRSFAFIGISWFIAVIFLSIDILDIPIGHLIPPDPLSPDYDIFLLGFEWAFFVVLIEALIAKLINRTLSVEKRLSQEVINKGLLVGGILSFSVWSFQLIIIELYLRRFFGIDLYNQDIRILIITVSIINFISFYLSVKFKFGQEGSRRNIQEIQFIAELDQKREQEHIKGEKRTVLDVQDLTTYFYTEEGVVQAVEGVSFKIFEGEVLGLVGETGCGKSVTALSILQLIYPPGIIQNGIIKFENIDLLEKAEEEILPFRGKDITMIFQDPLNSLNPVFKVGNQISEVFLLHKKKELLEEASKSQDKSIYSVAREWSENLLRDLNIPAPNLVYDRYPHELSGGMRQRVQIAMALVCRPKLLIADEPTTALDVTVQNQILKLMKDLKKISNTSILFITHDLGIISKMCDRVAVMYSGYIVESGKITILFTKPYHPYTKGLIATIPVVGKETDELAIIPGMVPNLIYPPSGCRFHPRCEYCFDPCSLEIPKSIEVEQDYFVACHLFDPKYKEISPLIPK
jgi:oligopeptide/dipeptide ABC transporter ATP-binding protein